MSRAIKIFGVGFSATDDSAEVEIKVDGSTIYSGTVTTDTNVDLKEYLLGSEMGEFECASWVEKDASAVKTLTITAVAGNFLYTQALTTYSGEENVTDPELFGLHSYSEQDGDIIADPNSNILLDGVEHEDGSPDDRSDLFGQWNVGVPEGSTMQCDLIIDGAPVKPESTDDSTIQ